MHRHKEPSRVLYYPLVWLQMIGIYWTKRVLCYYYVVLIGREGGGTAVEALKLLQSSIHAFQISGTLKLGFLPSNLVNIPPKNDAWYFTQNDYIIYAILPGLIGIPFWLKGIYSMRLFEH